MWAFLFLVLGVCARTSFAGVVAFDCQTAQVEVARISLDGVAECAPPPNITRVRESTVQILQTRKFAEVKVYQCVILVTELMVECGYNSHGAISAQGIRNYLHEIPAEDCRMLHKTKKFTFKGKNMTNPLAANATVRETILFHGSIDRHSSCSGSDYKLGETTYTDVTVQAALVVTLADYVTKVDLHENKVHLRSGLTCKYSDHSCIDSIEGLVAWDTFEVSECGRNSFHVVWSGPARIVSTTYAPDDAPEEHLIVESADSVFALKLLSAIPVCHLRAKQTEHSGLFVIENLGNGFYFQPTLSESRLYADTINYFSSKVVYALYQGRKDINQLFLLSAYKRCLVERETLKNRLLLARLAPEAASVLLHGKPGVIGRVAGDVLFILQCTPVMVEPKESRLCWEEQEVFYQNQTFFIKPGTRILTQKGVQVDCNPLTPSTFLVGPKHWISYSPSPSIVTAPVELEPSLETKLPFEPLQNLGGGGLYSIEELREAQKYFHGPQERSAIVNIIHRRIAGKDVENQGYMATRFLSPAEWEGLARGAVAKMWGWLKNFGNITSGILGIYLVFRIIKFVLNTLINAYSIYQITGISFSLVAALWSSLTMCVVHSHLGKRGERFLQTKIHQSNLPSIEEGTDRRCAQHNGPMYPTLEVDTNNRSFQQ